MPAAVEVENAGFIPLPAHLINDALVMNAAAYRHACNYIHTAQLHSCYHLEVC